MGFPWGAYDVVTFGVEWVQDFHADSCTEPDLLYRQSEAEGFYNIMQLHGHIGKFCFGDDNAWETDFCNPDLELGGDALNWSDNVNFCYFAGHGTHKQDQYVDDMWICFSYAHLGCFAASSRWKLGVKDLKWLVLDSCLGVTDPSADSVVFWAGPMQGIHIIFAYIGLSYDRGDLGVAFGNEAGTGSPLCNSWIDHAYTYDDYDPQVSNHPIAIAAGATQDEAIYRREHETINDLSYDVTSTSWLAWKWRD